MEILLILVSIFFKFVTKRYTKSISEIVGTLLDKVFFVKFYRL